MKTHQASKTHPLFLSLLGALVFGLISTALYNVRIPLVGTPVPVIIQPLSSFIASSVLGPWYGLISQFVMLAVLPYTFWAPFGGIALLWGPTSGYIWGFVCAGTIAAYFVQPSYSKTINSLLFLTTTLVCVHIPGMLVLRSWYWFAGNTVPTWSHLFHQAITPFIIGDTIKAVCAALIYGRIHRFIRK